MRRKRLFWRLYISYFLVTILSLVAVLFYASWALERFYFDRLKWDLEARARIVERQVRGLLFSHQDLVDSLCDDLGRVSNTRITVILPDGVVVGDSEKDPRLMDNHGDRPEVRAALAGGLGTKIRYSYTLKRDMAYVAIPVLADDRIIGAVRTSMPLTTVGSALRQVQGRIVFGGFVTALIVAVTTVFVSRRISRPLEQMKRGASRFAQGDLKTRLEVPDSEELGSLAEALNEMAAQLDARIRAVARQRSQTEAILASMAEGVIALDREQRVISMNTSAGKMLGIDAESVRGRSVQEISRNPELHSVVEQVLETQEPVASEVKLTDDDRRILKVRTSPLRGADGKMAGAVVVLDDVTHLRRLENIRREFVANVSHELRTPITSIKGFVETLLDGAVDDPEAARRFLRIVSRQVEQLNAIVEDLLLLSKVEEEAEMNRIILNPGSICEVLAAAVEVCEPKASKKGVPIRVECEPGLEALMNAPLLVQAVVNLIDNAVNYSEPGSPVYVRAARERTGITIRVEDRGCGIEPEHLPRLFERFYRVDKARSRKQGGTGLGLAIVKHIVEVHRGHVTVHSIPRQGSTFTIHLPT